MRFHLRKCPPTTKSLVWKWSQEHGESFETQIRKNVDFRPKNLEVASILKLNVKMAPEMSGFFNWLPLIEIIILQYLSSVFFRAWFFKISSMDVFKSYEICLAALIMVHDSWWSLSDIHGEIKISVTISVGRIAKLVTNIEKLSPKSDALRWSFQNIFAAFLIHHWGSDWSIIR